MANGLTWLLNLFLEKYSKVLLFYVRWTTVHICPRAIFILLISLTIYSTGMLTLTIHRTLCWSVMIVELGKQEKQVTLDALVRCIPAKRCAYKGFQGPEILVKFLCIQWYGYAETSS